MEENALTLIWKTAATGTVQDLISLGRKLSGSSMLLGDSILSVLAADCDGAERNWKWEDFIRAGFAPDFHDKVQFPRETRLVFDQLREGWYGCMPNQRAIALIDLHMENRSLCHFAVTSDSLEKLEQEMDLLNELSQALLVVMTRNETNFGNRLSIEQLLSKLIEEDMGDVEMMEARARLMDFPTEGFYVLLTIDTIGFHPVNDSLSTIVNKLKSMTKSATTIYKHNLVILQYYNREEELEDRSDSYRIAEILRENNLVGARSRAFFNLTGVHAHYLQTERMLRLRYCRRQDSLLEFYPMATLLLAEGLPKEERGLNACHPIVRKLVALDQESKFGYIETLKAYLESGQRVSLACEKLHVHRNTLDYRLRRLEEQVKLDWTDGDLMFQLYFSMHLLEILERID